MSHGSFCLLTAKVSDTNYILILCNSIGSPVDNRIVNIKPEFVSLNETHVVIANKHYVYVWQFRSSSGSANPHQYGHILAIDLLKKKLMKEFAFHIENDPNTNEVYNNETYNCLKTSSDPISAIFANESFLSISCESGRAFRYQLPHISKPDLISLGVKLNKIGLSKNGQYLWGFDDNNLLSIWDIEKSSSTGKKLKGHKLEFEKKDVWAVIWSGEENMKFAFLEKNRLNIIKEQEIEEVLTCNGYLAEYSQLEITAVMLDELMFKPWDYSLPVNEVVIKFETRILRDLREMMANNIDMNDIYQFVDQNSHRKLWELLAEYSLLNLDFITAEKAMIQYNDYMGLSFIKRVKSIDDDYLKKAEIHQFFLDYDKAEEVYMMVDRRDLIISMRIKLGHWEKVIALIKESGYVQEDNLKVAYNNYAQQFYENKEYSKAEELFKLTNNHEMLVNLWFKTEEFDKAAKFIEVIPEGSEFLLFMGDKFETVI